ncbi:MAG: RMD1 family protein [Bacteroidetes bacterium]|nr:RMD1 family protein [Bacteroidota bacterium]MBS1539371.1 RMD1 family protein [Bacteroidota bacterium]
MKTIKISALLVANQLDMKGIKAFLDLKPLADTSSELLYGFGGDKYQYYFNYGVVVFAGHSDDEIKVAVRTIMPYQKSPNPQWLRDDHEISIQDGEMLFEFDHVVVNRLDDKVLRIAMFNLAQSVALDYYHSVSENLLTEIRGFSRDLETSGTLNINRTNMLKFIGKALNTQNDIADNIYIFDAPDQVWDDEYLDKLHKGLMRHFDLRLRFSEIEYTLRIIEDNLSIFREISNQRTSTMLEWIIIILILVEVLNLFISKIL